LKFHDQRRSADSSYRVAYDSQSLQAFYSKGFFIFQSFISLATTFATMWYFDSTIALLSLLVVPLMMLAIYIYAKRIRDQSTTVAERESAKEVTLEWRESGLTGLRAPQHNSGFGSKLIETSTRQELGGRVDTTYRADGIFYSFWFPARS